MFLYDLYRNNASFPVDGYVEEFLIRFRMIVSKSTIERWFLTIGPFKGSMRVTSRYPSGRDSWATYNMLKSYLSFILSIDDHSRIVFADEKPMKEIDVYRLVRRDVLTGDTPTHELESANSKNRYSILAAVNIKGGDVPPVKSILIEKCTDSSIFLRFIRVLLLWRVLVRGDVFVIDNCTIHKFGDNIGTQEFLFREYGILMVCLPPYHPDFNPTELVFNTTLQRLASKRSRYKCWKIPTKNVNRADAFKECIRHELDSFSVKTVKSFYNKCGYNY
jgi:transposase